MIKIIRGGRASINFNDLAIVQSEHKYAHLMSFANTVFFSGSYHKTATDLDIYLMHKSTCHNSHIDSSQIRCSDRAIVVGQMFCDAMADILLHINRDKILEIFAEIDFAVFESDRQIIEEYGDIHIFKEKMQTFLLDRLEQYNHYFCEYPAHQIKTTHEAEKFGTGFGCAR
ncbi:MAG: hypothetical protein OEY79_04300 [Anaplasmataceae bacterium]|nr:hypothetical protein [Anaplasmataceae bacterium]